ncbi:MAG TPA: hypothetical protein VGN63_07800 [Flavisolibacter sp.]|jgi:hypothetical protein|nr:hypothetical protein [Flavisolibacter sp.]
MAVKKVLKINDNVVRITISVPKEIPPVYLGSWDYRPAGLQDLAVPSYKRQKTRNKFQKPISEQTKKMLKAVVFVPERTIDGG